jgi:hypothetical protein
MTDTEAEALGKRLVRCKGFRPLRGMLDMQGRTWDTSLLWRWSNVCDVPDLRDPATLGCVLALVREAWGNPLGFLENAGPNHVWNTIEVETIERDCEMGLEARSPCLLPPDGAMWVYHPHGQYPDPVEMSQGNTEAEALVAALEAAP